MDNSIFDRYYNLALRFLSYRPRSQKEVYDYLKGKSRRVAGINDQTIAEIMKRLVDLKFIDDVEFAKFWIEHRKKAARVLNRELVDKGISKDIIEKVTSSFDLSKKDNELMRKFIEKKKNLPYEKLVGYLMRRGFSYEEIRKELK
jgi:regulatory protein